MGLEVGDRSVSAMAEEVRSDYSVAALIGSCEALDLGVEEAVADSNGHLTEEEALGLGQHAEAQVEQAGEGASPESAVQDVSRLQVQTKKWSDFNAVSARTFGEQESFGSFSDFLADFPSDLAPQTAGVPQAVSDVDFFEWAASESNDSLLGGIGVGFVTPQPEPAAVAVVQEAMPELKELAPETGIVAFETGVVGHEDPALPQTQVHQDLPLEEVTEDRQQVQTWSDHPVEQGQTVGAEIEATQSADSYPGWYYDYQAGEWRQVENYTSSAAAAEEASISQKVEQSLENATGTSVSQPEGVHTNVEHAVVQSHLRLEESQDLGTQSAATQTTTDEYPGWTWDYAAHVWVPVPGYNESWQNTAGQAQSYSGQQLLYGQQEQQTQTYNDQPFVASQNEQQDPSRQQPQAFYPGYTSDSANVVSTGYTPQSGNVVNTGPVYGQEAKPWQGELQHSNAMTGGPPEIFTPHMNVDQGWAEHAFYNQEASMSQSMPSDTYSSSNSYSPSDSYNRYSANGMHNQFSQPTWGSTPQYNHYQQFTNPTASPPKNVHEAMRTCVGRPPHSVATFGFGGKLIYMKLRDPVTLHTSNGDQDVASGEAWMPGPVQVLSLSTYLPKGSSYAGPLMNGGASQKELNKWIDERVSTYPPYDSSRLLLGLLKVLCQHYGKLRSPNANSGNSSMEEAGPEAALAKLLAGSGEEQGSYSRGAYRTPLVLQGMPSEQLLQASALEVKKLLVSGKRKDALKCAQSGELWGIALILARQLGEKFYSDTVMEMARRQFAAGCPLRTLSLLLAGQPAEVFAVPPLQSGNPVDVTSAANDLTQDGVGGMLDEWQENLSIMASNGTPGDERVILHLGDRLWGVRGEVAAAHLCYLVADANLESYSGNARLCLIGADHCKYPRTYATAESIQRTEIYEYGKVLGNPQYVLLSFQPYKLVYAEMLAEVGKNAEALRYCQTVLKTLKTAGRTPDVEACRIVATNLEERLRMHMQDGHGLKLAPGKLVNRFLSTMDWSISRIIGGPPPSAAVVDPYAYRPMDNGGDHHGSTTSHPGSSSGQRPGAPLAPSASIAASMERLPQEPNRVPSRSQSEPDFGRNAKQGEGGGTPGSSPRAGLSRLGLGRLGSSFLQKATGLWGSQTNKAKLGDANKFYYDEKLKKWVEEGVEPNPEVAPPPPPPTTSNFVGSNPQGENHTLPPVVTLKPGTPPMIPSSNNQYSNRRPSGVRSRYVDTFNKGGLTSPSKLVLPSLIPPPRPGGGMSSMPAMFVPAPVPAASFSESSSEMGVNLFDGASRNGDESSSMGAFSNTADSDSNVETARDAGYPPTFMTPFQSCPQVTSTDNGLAVSTAESTDRDSLGGPPALGGAHVRAASWGGYPSAFQNSQFQGKENSYKASFGGTDGWSGAELAPPVASISAAPSNFTNFYMPNSGGMGSSMPPPPPLAVPSAALGGEGSGVAEYHRDPRENMMGQQLKGSQSVDSLGGDEMQEVEL